MARLASNPLTLPTFRPSSNLLSSHRREFASFKPSLVKQSHLPLKQNPPTRDHANFVMLNVDNTKWEQELDEFGVEVITHFAFLDKDGNKEGHVVGRFPRKYFLENVDALACGEASVPHVHVVGQYSSAESREVHQVADPRSHV